MDSFSTIFECVQKCDGLDMHLFRCITANEDSNIRIKTYCDVYVGYSWGLNCHRNGSFFGILLKISLLVLNLGGYRHTGRLRHISIAVMRIVIIYWVTIFELEV